MATSKGRAPLVCSPSRANATTAVITPPTSSGRPKSSRSAMAPPSTSARSVAMATNSACSHSPRVTGCGKWSRHSSARLFPVAMPALAERYWISMAIRLLTTSTQISR